MHFLKYFSLWSLYISFTSAHLDFIRSCHQITGKKWMQIHAMFVWDDKELCQKQHTVKNNSWTLIRLKSAQVYVARTLLDCWSFWVTPPNVNSLIKFYLMFLSLFVKEEKKTTSKQMNQTLFPIHSKYRVQKLLDDVRLPSIFATIVNVRMTPSALKWFNHLKR